MRSSRIPRPAGGTVACAVLALPPTVAYHYLGTPAAILVGAAAVFAAAFGGAKISTGHHVRGMRYVSVLVRDADGTTHEIDPAHSSLTEVSR